MDELERIRESAERVALRVAAGGRPGDWTEAEVVLAALVLFYADPSRLGGTRSSRSGPRQHPAVVAIAHAIGRTNDAVVMKVMNLRWWQTHGARGLRSGGQLDSWAIDVFRDRLDLLIAAAMAVAEQVPRASVALELLAPGRAIAPEPLGTADVTMPALDAPSTSAIRQVVVRRGQGLFRSRVMANYLHACAFCGLRARHPNSNTFFLFAGHILPWRDASDHQRLDPTNGLSLCPLHDRAFEWGFIGLDEHLHIVVSPAVHEHYEPEQRVRAELDSLHGQPLRTGAPGFEPPGGSYLVHHREHVFNRRFKTAVA